MNRDRLGLRPDVLLSGPSLRNSLIDAGYTQCALADVVGLSTPDERHDVDLIYRRVQADSPFNVLVRLFWLGHSVCEKTLRGLLPSLNVDELVTTGLLQRRNGDLYAAAKLAPYNDLLLTSDFGPEIVGAIHSDHVLGVGAASRTLAGITVRRRVRRALDLGTGAGIQAFLAAGHADQVIGTDVSRRALAFAEFNARLNAIVNVQWRMGNLYEPLRDDVFDLIVSNPPFVISPEFSFVFRDGGLPVDKLSQQVIREAGPRLVDGGFACILFNWHHRDSSDWAVRPGEWVSGTGCDALLICFKSTDGLTYAADWLRSSLGPARPEYGRGLDEWAAYYEQNGVVCISAGGMILRRRAASSNWFSARRMDSVRCLGPCGEQIQRIFAAEDLLARIKDDQELLQHRFCLAEDHELTHELKVSEGRWVLMRQTLRNRTGIPFSGELDIVVTELLARCDGLSTLATAISSIADSMHLESEKLQRACVDVVRKLLQSGFLHVSTTDTHFGDHHGE